MQKTLIGLLITLSIVSVCLYVMYENQRRTNQRLIKELEQVATFTLTLYDQCLMIEQELRTLQKQRTI